MKMKNMVAPFMGAWIEINIRVVLYLRVGVAPFMGAWIEMLLLNTCYT